MNTVEKVSAKLGRQMKNNNKKLHWFLAQHLKSLEVVTFMLTTRKTLNKMKISNFSKILWRSEITGQTAVLQIEETDSGYRESPLTEHRRGQYG